MALNTKNQINQSRNKILMSNLRTLVEKNQLIYIFNNPKLSLFYDVKYNLLLFTNLCKFYYFNHYEYYDILTNLSLQEPPLIITNNDAGCLLQSCGHPCIVRLQANNSNSSIPTADQLHQVRKQ